MESQLFIYKESTYLVKPAVTPLAVKKAPMKAFPVAKARSITSSGSTSKVGSSKVAVATATTQITKIRKEDPRQSQGCHLQRVRLKIQQNSYF